MRVGRTIHGMLFVIALLALRLEAHCDHWITPQRIENPAGLQTFFASLQRAAQQEPEALTRIIHYGDSHVAADWLTGKLRRNFQHEFGKEFIRYEAKGRNGARAMDALRWNWDALAERFVDNPPALIVVAYGSNEVGDADLDLDAYQTQFETLLQHCQAAAPEASLLVLAPPDRARYRHNRWRTMPLLQALIERQRAAAINAGTAFWDQFSAMGGAGSIHRWANATPKLAQKDRVHLTLAGYELIADAMYAELVREYEHYQQRTTKE